MYQTATTGLVGVEALQKMIASQEEWKEFNTDVAVAPLQASVLKMKETMEAEFWTSTLLKSGKDWQASVKGKFGAERIYAFGEELRQRQADVDLQVHVLKSKKLVREQAGVPASKSTPRKRQQV